MAETKTKKFSIKLWMIIVIAVVAVLGIGVGGFLYWESTLVWGTCYIEAGVSITPADFMCDPSMEASFTEGSEIPDTSVPGTYTVNITAQHMNHKSTLIVQDTIAPVAEVTSMSVTMGDTCDAMDFVTYVEDATEVSTEFVTDPDYSAYGEQPIQIRFVDAGGNETILDTTLLVSQVLTDIYVEAGSTKPTLKDFVVGGNSPKFVTDINSVDYLRPQNKKVQIIVDGIEYESIMHIQDTIAPVVQFTDVNSFTGITRKPDDFIVSAEDKTALVYSFETEPVIDQVGEQSLVVIVTDAGGNATSQEVKLTLEEDTEAPVIDGVHEITVFVNGTISYMSGVTISDNCSEGLKTSVNHDAVNGTVAGDYPITYTATDASGNTTSVDTVVHVKERVYDANEINAIADGILASIIHDGMSGYDKALAIFNYVKSHVSYLNGSDKNNYLRAAYEGLVEGKGDCFVYASTSKILLTRAGLTNLDIAKIPSSTHHYWNLVDIGDGHGWYHFDTTPRKDHPVIFLWDETTMMNYSNQHHGSHNYDHEIYPIVP